MAMGDFNGGGNEQHLADAKVAWDEQSVATGRRDWPVVLRPLAISILESIATEKTPPFFFFYINPLTK